MPRVLAFRAREDRPIERLLSSSASSRLPAAAGVKRTGRWAGSMDGRWSIVRKIALLQPGEYCLVMDLVDHILAKNPKGGA